MRDAAPHPANPLKRVGAQTLLRKTAFCGGYFQEFGNQKKPCAFRLQKYPVFSRAFVRLTEGARDNVPCRVRDRVPYSAAFFRKKADYAASVEQEISGNLFSCFDYGSGSCRNGASSVPPSCGEKCHIAYGGAGPHRFRACALGVVFYPPAGAACRFFSAAVCKTLLSAPPQPYPQPQGRDGICLSFRSAVSDSGGRLVCKKNRRDRFGAHRGADWRLSAQCGRFAGAAEPQAGGIRRSAERGRHAFRLDR